MSSLASHSQGPREVIPSLKTQGDRKGTSRRIEMDGPDAKESYTGGVGSAMPSPLSSFMHGSPTIAEIGLREGWKSQQTSPRGPASLLAFAAVAAVAGPWGRPVEGEGPSVEQGADGRPKQSPVYPAYRPALRLCARNDQEGGCIPPSGGSDNVTAIRNVAKRTLERREAVGDAMLGRPRPGVVHAARGGCL